jgi:hypothetical protein
MSAFGLGLGDQRKASLRIKILVRPCSAHDDDAGINLRRQSVLFGYAVRRGVGSKKVRFCQWRPGRTAVAYIVLKRDFLAMPPTPPFHADPSA